MEQNNLHIDPVELISKVLAGEATMQEQAQLDTWIAQSVDNKQLFDSYSQVWNITDVQPKESLIDIEAEWAQLQSRLSQTSNVININSSKRFTFLKIAAIAIILICSGIGIALLFNVVTIDQMAGVIPIEFKGAQYNNEFATGTNMQTKTLADGSQITLNAHAKISYSSVFKGNKRAVKLEGEAFFEVTPDATKPFIIDAGAVYVEVLGTSFLVNADNTSDSVVIIVNTGKVEVTDKSDDQNTLILLPGERAVFYKKNSILEKEENKDENYISWKSGKIIFNDSKLTQITRTLNKVYKVKIIINNDEIKDCRVTATFANQPLSTILTVISATLDVAVIKKGEIYEISGKGCK